MRNLVLFQGIRTPCVEPPFLLLLGYGKVEFEELDPILDKHLFKERGVFEKTLVLRIGAETRYRFHHSPVVPGTVEQNDFAGPGKLFYIPFHVEFRLLSLAWLAQCHYPVMFFVHVSGHPPDGSPLARGIPAVKGDYHLFAGFFQVLLQLDQFCLIRFEFFLIEVFLQSYFQDFVSVLFLDEFPYFFAAFSVAIDFFEVFTYIVQGYSDDFRDSLV